MHPLVVVYLSLIFEFDDLFYQDYMPSPLDVPAIQGISADGKETPIERKSSDNEPFSALAFKIMNDPFVGEFISCMLRLLPSKIRAQYILSYTIQLFCL